MKNFNVQNIVRENIKKMSPYSSARDEFKDFTHTMIYLDANENPFANGFNRYPDPQQKKLKTVVAKQKKIQENQLLLGNGSDEVIDILFRAFCEPNRDNVITMPPTYGMFDVLANCNAIENKQVVLLETFEPDVEAVLKAVTDNTKMIFLCSPNNPTGNSFSDESIVTLLQKFNGIVVLDEAYIDFSKNNSWLSELVDFPNLVIIQTLSKAYALAGLRIGMVIASAEIIEILNKIKPPYNINCSSQDIAEKKVLQNTLDVQVRKIKAEREKLIYILENINFVEKIYPSDANFVLVKVDDAAKRYNQLIENGIVVRNRSSQMLCHNCLRISIGTKEENEILIKTLKKIQ